MHNKNFIQLVLYGIFGVLTTILAWFIYWAATRLLHFGTASATAWSWFLAVLFAYATNRRYVFHSDVNTFSGIMKECGNFILARLGTGILDVVIMYVFVDILNFYDMPVKIISNIIVIILNYVFSKILVFKEKRA